MIRKRAALAVFGVLVAACSSTSSVATTSGPVAERDVSPISTTVMPLNVPSAEDEQSFLNIFKAWVREVPDLPPTSDADFVRFGYEACDGIETSVAEGDSPQGAAQVEVADAVRPDGMIDGGKGDVLLIRLGLYMAGTEYLCPVPNLPQWAEQFEEAVFDTMQNLTDGQD